jgi:hypothetical protein
MKYLKRSRLRHSVKYRNATVRVTETKRLMRRCVEGRAHPIQRVNNDVTRQLHGQCTVPIAKAKLSKVEARVGDRRKK